MSIDMYIDVEVNKGGAWKSITPSLGSLNFDDSKSDDLGYVETFMMRSPLVKDYALFHTLGLDVPGFNGDGSRIKVLKGIPKDCDSSIEIRSHSTHMTYSEMLEEIPWDGDRLFAGYVPSKVWHDFVIGSHKMPRVRYSEVFGSDLKVGTPDQYEDNPSAYDLVQASWSVPGYAKSTNLHQWLHSDEVNKIVNEYGSDKVRFIIQWER